jgi:hypothetical protein
MTLQHLDPSLRYSVPLVPRHGSTLHLDLGSFLDPHRVGSCVHITPSLSANPCSLCFVPTCIARFGVPLSNAINIVG